MGKTGEIGDLGTGTGNGANPFVHSDSVFSDINPRAQLQFWQAQRGADAPVGGDATIVQPAAAVSDKMLPPRNTPEGEEFYKAMESPGGAMRFSSPADNAADGKTPDYQLVSENGQIRLVRTGQGDPMSDGEMNVEIDPGNKSLQDAIMQNDKNMKEFAREMIAYWQKSHPGEAVPSMWQSILDKQPDLPPEKYTPTPISRTPGPKVNTPEPNPPSPNPGWQNDYRGGGGSGYGRSGYGGSRGNPGGDSYYRGGPQGNNWNVPSDVPQWRDNQFIDKIAATVMANEHAMTPDGKPNFTAYNPDDNGGISVGIRQWHQGGALPELLNAWQQADPQKFQEYFQGMSPAQINSMNAQQFKATPGMEEGMMKALQDPKYQQVQTQLMQDWVKREVKMAMDGGLTGEREIATYVDVANSKGQDAANQLLTIGKAKGDQSEAMSQAVRGDGGERQARIRENFTDKDALLQPAKPEISQFNEKLARAVEVWDSRMSGTGYCARAVQRAMADAGLPQFVGSGNAWDMMGPLKRSGLFVQITQAEAQRGDIIVRPPHPGGSQYGDISVVTARSGNRIQQTNDATYEFRAENPRYGGQAVFLRYVGDQRNAATEDPANPKKTTNG